MTVILNARFDDTLSTVLCANPDTEGVAVAHLRLGLYKAR